MIAKNHEPNPLALQVVDTEQVEKEQLGEDIDEGSTATNFQHIAQEEDLSPRSVNKKKSRTKQARKQKEKIVPFSVKPKRIGISYSKSCLWIIH